MDLVLVGIGGALGSLARYQLGKLVAEKSDTTFPMGTFLINITGAILLGMLSSLDFGRNMYLLFSDGFLGAYTTFSTFLYEGFHLFQENEKMNAFAYILGSLILGIIGYVLGFEFIKLL